MKKIFSVVILVVLYLSLCGCFDTTDKTIYDDFNQMSRVSYTDYSISIKRVADGETLSSSYKIRTEGGVSKIEYSYEVLNPIEEVDGNFIVPEEYKSTKNGSVTVQNGKIVEMNGEELNVDITEIDGIALKFAESYFDDISDKDNCFTAKVKNVDKFLGKHVDCLNMTVEIEYTESQFKKVKISYMANDASIETEYLFG